ncbi:acetolactate synthase large subunit [Rhodococcus sp. T2V]|uniref:acetolactate synthase large subunit n=1 Tax=Rhodococcus sp. T2V TaxID=3034164 RepID=UPI0023E1D7FE|nr:acetolactate synthase large subunit [Rhodococcus sp. T2V]MDF3309632.1 acetolactate synthase large subunit [Rhodococcus sp. T2V]
MSGRSRRRRIRVVVDRADPTPDFDPRIPVSAPTQLDRPARRTCADIRHLPQRVTGAQAVVRALEELGVECVFGIPGGAILPVYDPLLESTRVRHVLVRHEQGAGHAATGYAQATGKVGVCVATSGPGATNLVTPLADAQMDSVPVVAITGQVGRGLIGTDAFQEADICGITMPITKHNFLVTDPADIPRIIAEAFHIASSGRPGAVLVDIPKDVLQAITTFSWPPERQLPGYRPVTKPHSKQVRAGAALINSAAAPVLYVGGGVIKADAAAELRELAELTGIPVVTTLMALGAFPDSHPLHYGMPGMHGTVAAVAALQRSDLLITLGARFDDRVTGHAASFAPHAQVIHADIDPAEIGKNREVDVPIVGDCRETLRALIAALRLERAAGGAPDLQGWRASLDEVRETYPVSYDRPADGMLSPQLVIEAVGKAAGPDAIYVSGVGQHQMWAAHFVGFEKPRTWLNSGGLGTMGYAVPAALGAKLAAPEKEVWAIDGDGCFQMTNQELATAAIEGVPIKVALINNGNLGMVKQLQAVHYDGRYCSIDLATHSRRIPDFVKLADALGCVALRCEREEDVESVIEQARAITDRPVVIDFVVSDDALVWPMIAAGTSNDHIMAAKGIRPLFDEDDLDKV